MMMPADITAISARKENIASHKCGARGSRTFSVCSIEFSPLVLLSYRLNNCCIVSVNIHQKRLYHKFIKKVTHFNKLNR